MNKKKYSWFVSIVLGLGASSLSADSFADTYAAGYPNAGFEPDNKSHSYCYGQNWMFWNTYILRGAGDATTYLNDGTAMTTVFEGNRTSDCNSQTDAILRADLTTPGVRGSYSCQAFAANGECSSSLVSINSDLMTTNYGTFGAPLQAQARKTFCHEYGHSVGLPHYSSGTWGCMISGESTAQTYVTHHLDHITNDIN